MFRWIKRLLNTQGVMFCTDWENLDNDEKLSLLAGAVSDSELNRIIYLTAKENQRNWNLADIQKFEFTENNSGLLFFKNSTHPLFFFVEIHED